MVRLTIEAIVVGITTGLLFLKLSIVKATWGIGGIRCPSSIVILAIGPVLSILAPVGLRLLLAKS